MCEKKVGEGENVVRGSAVSVRACPQTAGGPAAAPPYATLFDCHPNLAA